MRRLFILILVLLILFAVLFTGAMITVQLVLESDLPRRIAVDVLQRETGLNVEIDSVEIGREGRTVVRGFRARLPFEPDPFVTISRIEVTHSSLWSIMTAWRVEIESIHVIEPTVAATWDDRGRWNLLRALDMVTANQVSSGAEGPGALLPLPHLRVERASVSIQTPDGSMRTFDDLGLTGEPVGAGGWRFDLDFAPDVQLEGRLAPRARWEHEATFALLEIRPLLEPWFPELPERLLASGTWSGTFYDGVLAGRLTLDEVGADRADLSGEADVRLAGGSLSIMPQMLHVRVGDVRVDPVVLRGGTITTDGDQITFHRLDALLETRQLRAGISGTYSISQERGEASIAWRGSEMWFDTAHEGDGRVTFDVPAFGRKTLSATFNTTVNSSHGRVETALELSASGREWHAMRGSLHAETLRVERPEGTLVLDGMTAEVGLDWPVAILHRLGLGDEPVSGSGRFDLDTRAWRAEFHAGGWKLPELFDAYMVDALHLDVLAHGDMDTIHIERLEARQGGLSLTAAGRYRLDPGDEPPLEFQTRFRGTLTEEDGQPVTGTAEMTVVGRGTVEPLALEMSGALSAPNPVVFGRALRPVDITWTGTADMDRVEVSTPELALMGGRWSAEGAYHPATASLELRARSADSSLARIIELAEIPVALAGIVSADVEIELPGMNLNELRIVGGWQVDALEGPGLVAAEAAGRLTVDGLDVTLHETRLLAEGGAITGEASFRLDQTDRVHLDITCENLILETELPPLQGHPILLTAVVDGSALLVVNLVELGADGTLDLRGDLQMNNVHFAEFGSGGSMAGRTVTMPGVWLETLDGRAEGDLRIVLDRAHWQQARLRLAGDGFDLARLGAHLPPFERLTGHVAGELVFARSTDPRAHEPMELRFTGTFTDGQYGPVGIESFDITGYLGEERLLLDRATARAADGDVMIWARLRRHGDEPSLHVDVEFDSVDLNQVAQLFVLSDGPVPGRVSGAVAFGGYPFSENYRLFGRGRASLRESELAGLPGFSELYSLVNLDFSRDNPTGSGEAVIRMEGNAVEISRLTYFNKGTDIVARLSIENIWAGDRSPIFGVAAGAARPLKGWDLPILSRLDRLLNAIQTDAASVQIGGTLAAPEAEVVPFGQITGAVQRILSGSALN